MPTYEYACNKCDEHFEVYQSFSDDPLTTHDGCGGKLSKVFGSVGIVLKGSGFYKTDNGSRSKAKTRSNGSDGSDAASSPDKTSGGASDEKSAKKGAPKSDAASTKKSGSDSSTTASKAGAGT